MSTEGAYPKTPARARPRNPKPTCDAQAALPCAQNGQLPCKTLFTQRFKQSGMKWSLEGGQVVVDLRVIWISKLWRNVFATYVKRSSQAEGRTKVTLDANSFEMAA